MDKLSMKAVLRQTGLSADNLRAWERRHQAVTPQRAPNGRRQYTSQELQRLQLLVQLVDAGHAIGQIARLPEDRLVRLLAQSSTPSHSVTYSSSTAVEQTIGEVMAAVDAFDLSETQSALIRLRFLVSPKDLVSRFVPQIMMLIGKRIDTGKISIAQEHALSELIQTHLRRIYEDLERPSSKQESLIFCTREGDPHDLGLFMAAITCRHRGYKTHFLGRSLPVQSIQEAVTKLKPKAVVVGLSELPTENEKIAPRAFLREVDQKIPQSVEIWAGGNATPSLGRGSTKRDIWIFENIEALEKKLG